MCGGLNLTAMRPMKPWGSAGSTCSDAPTPSRRSRVLKSTAARGRQLKTWKRFFSFPFSSPFPIVPLFMCSNVATVLGTDKKCCFQKRLGALYVGPIDHGEGSGGGASRPRLTVVEEGVEAAGYEVRARKAGEKVVGAVVRAQARVEVVAQRPRRQTRRRPRRRPRCIGAEASTLPRLPRLKRLKRTAR